MLVVPGTKVPPKFRRVYGGCEGCRRRHIRCDKGVTSCRQCVDKHVVCPGYARKFTFVEGPSARAKRRLNLKASVSRAAVDDDLTGRSNISPTKEPSPSRRHLPVLPIAVNVCNSDVGDEGGKRLREEQNEALNAPYTLTASTSVPWPGFHNEYSEQSRRKYFLDHYFDKMANSFPIMEGPTNPFGENFKQYLFQSDALTFAIMSMSAAYLEKMAYAWQYRAIALKVMQRDARQQAYSVEMLAAILFLGTTETSRCWFDAANSSSPHLLAASRLMLHTIKCGIKVPLFLTNFLCWFGTLMSFVSDNEDHALSSSTTYALWTAGVPYSAQDGASTEIDPLVGDWGNLMPLVATVGTIARQLRRGSNERDVKKRIDHVETCLLEWGRLGQSCLEERNPHDNTSEYHSPTDFDNIAEAYRLSSLLTLYNFCPRLLRKRVSLLNDGEVTTEILLRLALSTTTLLRHIPAQSRLWRVCSLPILSAAQWVTESSDRDFLRSMTNISTHKTRLSSIHCVRKLLEDVWQRRDAGFDIWWMGILDEGGTPILIN
ncbi:hypothetical protein LTR84_008916 [Exophiala bonariae]|uniref:Zn(2)-C6 fungal-type domain-containing protein n=1 Tax=Exophiala bonariae TaxID=1690606 RepID=A0AAV9MY29_9EURO|nr:hypothetical protein LTR84_008916 [Exophiala bonariae]